MKTIRQLHLEEQREAEVQQLLNAAARKLEADLEQIERNHRRDVLQLKIINIIVQIVVVGALLGIVAWSIWGAMR